MRRILLCAAGLSLCLSCLAACAPQAPHPDDIAALHAAVQQQAAPFVTCFSEGQKQDPALAGRIAVQMRVRDNGAVEDVVLRLNELGDDVGACFVRTFAAMQMPRLTRDTPFEESFCFDPSEDGARCHKDAP
ncbi:MAG: hypothetical protein M0R76_09510 [Proteobacteria bacterium]|nr:hypothetical protein [Pseudomonadota bacterium]